MKKLGTMVVAAAVGGLSSAASADVINVNVAYDSANGRYLDVGLNSDSSVSGQVGGTSLIVGESGVYLSKAYISFVLTDDQRALISQSGTTIKLGLIVNGQQNNSALTVDVWGLNNHNATAVASPSDYSGGELVAPSLVSGGSLVTLSRYFTVDVTSFVRAESTNNSIIAFRLELNSPPSADSVTNNVSFASADRAANTRPLLIIENAAVPEPAGLALLALGCFGFLAMPRRK